MLNKVNLQRWRKQDFAKTLIKYKEWLGSLGCLVCGCSLINCLETHHLDSSYKRQHSQPHKLNEKHIKEGKVVVLCANCHRLFHSHFGGKNKTFPPQTKESTMAIILLERTK